MSKIKSCVDLLNTLIGFDDYNGEFDINFFGNLTRIKSKKKESQMC